MFLVSKFFHKGTAASQCFLFLFPMAPSITIYMTLPWNSQFTKPDFSNMWTVNFQMFKLVLEKAEEPVIKLLKSDLENLNITLLVCEMSAIVWYFEHSLALPFFGIGMKTDHFQSCGYCGVFQICWHTECSTFTASSFRIWNSSTGKGKCSFRSQRKAMPKNAQTTAQLHSSHMLVK